MTVEYVSIDTLLDRDELARITEAAALAGMTIEAFIVAAVTDYVNRPRSRNQREGRFVGHAWGKPVRSRHAGRKVGSSAAWIEVHQRVNGRGPGLPGRPDWAKAAR
jgi:hypothetical protein